jgi:glycosyltransferase involved in cell wall biosynthesis
VPSAPRVSVVMPVFQAERFLAEAVRSILLQTYADFELLVFDDGSGDRSRAILREFAAADARIRLFEETHAGYVTWLNRGLELAHGEFVARMDADDVSLPERFERQVRFLDAHPDVVALGTHALFIDSDGDPIAPTEKPLDHDEIDRQHIAPGCQGAMITHPSAMLRRAAALAAGGYRPEAVLVDDLDLFLRMAERGHLANLADVLLHYRIHPDSLGVSRRAQQIEAIRRVVGEARRRRGLAAPETPAGAPPRTTGEDTRRWIIQAAREHGFTRTARKHALGAWRACPWSRLSWHLLRQAWLGR